MRVHLKGVVIAVGVLLAIVLVVSLFNALDTPPDSRKARSRHSLSLETEAGDEEGLSPSRMSPRSSTRLRAPGAPRGGPRGGAADPGTAAGGIGGGARAAVGAGGAGARAGGAMARTGAAAGGPRGGPLARGGARNRPVDEGDDDNFEIDETPSENYAEERPAVRGKAGGRMTGASQVGAGAGTATRVAGVPAKRGGPKKAPKARAAEGSEEKGEEEEADKKKKKKEPPYPDWWKTSYPRSAVVPYLDQFVGDQPLFPECPTFDSGTGGVKVKRYGLVEPPNFMKNSKNPCWFEWNGKKDLIKCVPYFYVAGVPKAGTEDLYSRLTQHPSVMQGGSSAYYWWDRLRYGATRTLKYTREAKRTDETVALKDYAKELVANHGKNITKELLYLGKSESIFGDATPTYLVENTQWDVFEGNEGCSEPRVIPATFIRHMFPEARIVIMLRDPVDRLYSRFLANVPYAEEFVNHTASLFHTFAVQAVREYKECFAKTSIRHCAYNGSLFSNAVIRLSEGMYPIFLEDWFRIFPKEQILVIKYEEYIKDIQAHLFKVFSHLNTGAPDEVSVQKMAELPRVRHGKTPEEEGFMLLETVQLLTDFYDPFNMKLADLLGDDKWLFKDNKISTAATKPPGVHGVDVEEEDNNEAALEGEGEEEERIGEREEDVQEKKNKDGEQVAKMDEEAEDEDRDEENEMEEMDV